tara:strand:- start:2624 stop:3202 length:579 start_codon:yes stop_codon:yes gene_type:complete
MYKGIILFGPPGVGKGSEGKLLGDMGDYFHFSSGEMFRNLDQHTKLGKKVSELIDKGNFIDDHVTLELARQTLMSHRAHGRYSPDSQYILLDGLPRNIKQVPMVNKFVDIQQVINFYVPNEDILVDRIKSRAEKQGRADDANEAIIRKRLKIYHQNTKPMLDLYSSEIIINIDGSGSIQEVHYKVLEQLRIK